MKISEKLIKDIFDDLNKRYDIQENNIFFLLNNIFFLLKNIFYIIND